MLKNKKLGIKIGTGFAIVLILTIAVGIIGYRNLEKVLQSATDVQDANRLTIFVYKARQAEKNFAFTADEKSAAAVETNLNKLSETASTLRSRDLDDEISGILQNISALGAEYKKVFNRFAVLEKQKPETAALMDQAALDMVKLVEELRAGLQTELALAKTADEQVSEEKMYISDSVANLVQLILTGYGQGATYLLQNDEQAFKMMKVNLAEAASTCEMMKNALTKTEDQEMIAAAKEAIEKLPYNIKAFHEKYVEDSPEKKAAWDKLAEEVDFLVQDLSFWRSDQMIGVQDGKMALLEKEKVAAQRTQHANQLLKTILEARIQEQSYRLTSSLDDLDGVKEKFEAAGKAAKELGQWFTGDNNKRAAKAAEQKAGEYLERILDFQKIFEEQAKSSGEMLRLSDQVESEAEKFQTVQTAAMSTLRSTSRSVIMGGTALVVLLGLIITIFMTRGLTRPIKKGVELAGLISRGNLSNRLDIESRDEIGDLARALNVMADSLEKKAGLAAAISSGNLTMDAEMASDEDILGQALGGMVDSLNDVLGQVGTAVSQVAAGSGQVADSSQSLSQGASEQAAALEEISSSLNQLGYQTKTNAENSVQAREMAEDSRSLMKGGFEKMQTMIEAMKEISDSSREIDKIIKAIDDIAFQTNLLALNAAVEAARAGKHGKGFAVVAQEVRSLAGRSAEAARQTAELIAGSVDKVEYGSRIVNETAEALEKMREANLKVTSLIGEIAEASSDQANGISQINIGLDQVEKVTQSNTAGAEQAASAAEELSSQAAALKQLLTRFKLKENSISYAEYDYMEEPRNGWDDRNVYSLPDSRGLKQDGMIKPGDAISLDDDSFDRY